MKVDKVWLMGKADTEEIDLIGYRARVVWSWRWPFVAISYVFVVRRRHD